MFKRSLTLGLAGTLSLFSLLSTAETLQDIYALALDNDHQLKADSAAYRAGLEYRAIGRSYLLPQVSARAQYSETEDDNSRQNSFVFDNKTVPSSSQGESDTDSTNYSVSLNQPLFDMAAWFGYKQGIALSEQAKAQYSADQQSLIIRVSNAYFAVLRSIDNMETSLAEENALGHQLEQTKQRFEVGLTSITDVHEAQAAYDNSTATTLESQGNLGIAFEGLEVLTGHSHATVAPLLESFPVIKPEPMARHEWVEFSLQNNFSLKAAKLNAKAARQNTKVKSSGHLPTLTASLNYSDTDNDGTDTQGLPSASTSEANTWAVTLEVPLYSGGRVSGERRQAHAQHMQAKEIYNKTQRDIIQGTRSLHLSVVINVAQVKARKQAITSSTSALEATQAGYEVGTRNLVDVLVAQRNVYQSQRNYDDTRYGYIINMLQLKEVAGNLAPADMVQLTRWLDADKQVERSTYE